MIKYIYPYYCYLFLSCAHLSFAPQISLRNLCAERNLSQIPLARKSISFADFALQNLLSAGNCFAIPCAHRNFRRKFLCTAWNDYIIPRARRFSFRKSPRAGVAKPGQQPFSFLFREKKNVWRKRKERRNCINNPLFFLSFSPVADQRRKIEGLVSKGFSGSNPDLRIFPDVGLCFVKITNAFEHDKTSDLVV